MFTSKPRQSSLRGVAGEDRSGIACYCFELFHNYVSPVAKILNQWSGPAAWAPTVNAQRSPINY